MTYKTLCEQKEATNEMLRLLNAPFRIAFMSQNKHTRITIEMGTPEQIEKGTAQNSVLYYSTVKEANKFLCGFNAALNALNFTNYPCNKI